MPLPHSPIQASLHQFRPSHHVIHPPIHPPFHLSLFLPTGSSSSLSGPGRVQQKDHLQLSSSLHGRVEPGCLKPRVREAQACYSTLCLSLDVVWVRSGRRDEGRKSSKSSRPDELAFLSRSRRRPRWPRLTTTTTTSTTRRILLVTVRRRVYLENEGMAQKESAER